jgi:hypothetical protein
LPFFPSAMRRQLRAKRSNDQALKQERELDKHESHLR